MSCERFHPGAFLPPWLRHQHFARYRWAAQRISGRVIVDAACGTGFGVQELRRLPGRRVIGIDLAGPSLLQASREHGGAQTLFVEGDVQSLPIASESVESFVSFETIEHVASDRDFLGEVRRVLRPGGAFLCSTPNRIVTNPGLSIDRRPFNPYHLREYSLPELRELLQGFFSHVEMLGQRPYGARYLAVTALSAACTPGSERGSTRLGSCCRRRGIAPSDTRRFRSRAGPSRKCCLPCAPSRRSEVAVDRPPRGRSERRMRGIPAAAARRAELAEPPA